MSSLLTLKHFDPFGVFSGVGYEADLSFPRSPGIVFRRGPAEIKLLAVDASPLGDRAKGGFHRDLNSCWTWRTLCSVVLHIILQGGYRDLVGGLGEEVACPGEREPRISKFPSTGMKVKAEAFPVFSRQLSPLLSSTLKPSEDPLCLYTQFRLLFLLLF